MFVLRLTIAASRHRKPLHSSLHSFCSRRRWRSLKKLLLDRYTLLSSGTNGVLSSRAASPVLPQYRSHAMEAEWAGHRNYTCGRRRSAKDKQEMDGAMRVSAVAGAACGRAKGVCLVVITLLLWVFKSWRVVELGRSWDLIEDAMKWRMMGEVESKHVSICCRDIGATKRNFHLGQISPKPKDVVQGWAERRRWTRRNNSRGPAAACLCLPEYKWKIKQIGAPTKLWHRNQPPNDTHCRVANGDIF